MKICLLFLVMFSVKTAVSAASHRYPAKRNDVVINEIFADPSPVVGLPSAEFVEIWNVSGADIPLKGWQFTDGATKATFAGDSIKAGAFIILCAKADAGLFSAYGKVIGLSPWPSLNNAGELLTLTDDRGTVISQEYFNDSWYRDAVKKQGGWTLEMIDPLSACSGSQNWAVSSDGRGGSPGTLNAVYKVGFGAGQLSLLEARLTDSVTVRLRFSRAVDSAAAANAGNYRFNNGLGVPVSAVPVAPEFTRVDIKFSAVIARGHTYTVSVSGIRDCAGATLPPLLGSTVFVAPGAIAKGDLLISEILFNPRPGGADYLEIYNASALVLDIAELYVASADEKDSLASLKKLSDTSVFVQPGGYRVFSVDPVNIKAEYNVKFPANLLKVAGLPSFNDQAGTAVLVRGTTRIDQFSYSEKMHFPLIKNPEGISLERSSFKRPAAEAGNFRSAATWSGGGTPGYENSQQSVENRSADDIYLSSTTFSPDNDGFEDLLTINFRFNAPGWVANVSIYSDRGVLVRRLVTNETLPAEGVIVWDGLNALQQKQAFGIYVVSIEVFDLDGAARRYRKPCVLAAKLRR
ncbi:lamin tail domain-containing protein [Hufsiella ginkgonis]|uniref:LTD domain-containing protein n=1 Tax=Hufsiella ginkgonis TaxID=2695274 RepID=A0A7K1XSY2_9SPHI|nr:lamin tail domain-containing protein [Hufsiella ginkgonis]MXV13869.1 hypothetical protein [Hufsiella ginkgonis]